MLQTRSIHRLDQIEIGLRRAAALHGGSVLSASRMAAEAFTFTLCLSDLYAPLLASDTRFAAFLPCRIAACAHGNAVNLETISPREFCRILHRPELESLTAPLEEALRAIMDEAAQPTVRTAAVEAEHRATEDQVNMRAAVPQRIDCHGTKIEELAGVGTHDAQGG
ncbi:MAG: hypothetical protein LAQ69_02965 [Acidobacteriia bacterium]|nr:hypothetical protein [Terriglobia bacterium]